jgi:hypothetical protein
MLLLNNDLLSNVHSRVIPSCNCGADFEIREIAVAPYETDAQCPTSKPKRVVLQ